MFYSFSFYIWFCNFFHNFFRCLIRHQTGNRKRQMRQCFTVFDNNFSALRFYEFNRSIVHIFVISADYNHIMAVMCNS